RYTTSYDLYVANPRGGAPMLAAAGLKVFGGAYLDVHRWSPVGDRLVFVRDGMLWRVDMTGEGPGPAVRLAAEMEGLHPSRIHFTPDGRHVLVEARLAAADGT